MVNIFKVDTLVLKRKFYAACNAVLSKLRDASEPVLLHLLRTKCLPIVLYSLGAMQLSSKNVRDLSVAWNDAYRRILNFHYARWESVKELMYFCGDLDMKHLYNMHRWEFMIDVRTKFFIVQFCWNN